MNRCCRFAFVLLLFLSSWAKAGTNLPRNLTASDETRALEILGYGSAAKILGNPYPLGGYSGIEVGVTSEFIPLDDLSRLGSKSSDNGEYNFYSLTFSKGLYYNIDTMIYFTPLIQSEELQSFGGQIRWGFYEAGFFPISFSLLAYLGGANYDNLVSTTTMGMDLIGTVNMENVALYFGWGRARAQGTFMGNGGSGTGGITASGATEGQTIERDHGVVGVSVDISNFFVALEIDRYVDSVYAGKLGFRF